MAWSSGPSEELVGLTPRRSPIARRTSGVLEVRVQRHAQPSHGRRPTRLLANLLAEHRRVVPTEIQFGIRGEPAQRAERLGATGVVVQEHVAFLTLDQCDYVD